MAVVAQSIILKSVLFKNLMRAFTMYFLSISQIFIFSKYMWAVGQKHNYRLEWPNHLSVCVCVCRAGLRNCGALGKVI